MRTAQESAAKYSTRAANASGDYKAGVLSTSKDQNARAIASAEIHKQATIEALNRGAYAAGLKKSSTQAYKDGVTKKGESRFAEGVRLSADKYATGSAPFDAARNAAANIPRGLKGSQTNLARVTAVVNALRTQKTKA